MTLLAMISCSLVGHQPVSADRWHPSRAARIVTEWELTVACARCGKLLEHLLERFDPATGAPVPTTAPEPSAVIARAIAFERGVLEGLRQAVLYLEDHGWTEAAASFADAIARREVTIGELERRK